MEVGHYFALRWGYLPESQDPQRPKKEGDKNSNRESEDSAYGFGEYAFKTNLFFWKYFF